MKEKKAAACNVESPAAVDGGLSQNESQSGISTPQFFKSRTWHLHSLSSSLYSQTLSLWSEKKAKSHNIYFLLQAKSLKTEEICDQVTRSTMKEIIRGLSSPFQHHWEEVRTIQATFASKSIRACQLCDRLN